MVKNKKLISSIAIFIFFSVYVTLTNLNLQEFSYDRIWVFHMLQKVANGHQLYTEINVLVGPVFYIFGGVFFKLFGSNFITYDILGGLLYGALATLVYNITKEINKYDNKFINLLMLVVIAFFARYLIYANYNVLAIFFIMLAMYIEIRKVKGKGGKLSNYLIGVCLSFAFFSKQTIGGMAVIATGLVSLIDGILVKKKNPIKEILEKAAGFFIVLIPIVLAMIINGNFLAYIDLCFGSILEFGGNNLSFTDSTLYLTLMLAVQLSSIFICKSRKDDTEFLVITLYSMALMFFMYPIFNSYHMHIATLAIWFLIIKLLNVCLENNHENIFKMFSIIILASFIVSMYTFNNNENTEAIKIQIELEDIKNLCLNIIDVIILCGTGIALIKDNSKISKNTLIVCGVALIMILSLGYIYGLKDNNVPEGLEIYANHGFENERLEEIANVINYIQNKEEEGYKVYGVSWDASEYFVPMNRNNNKFDLLLNGNLGYKGKEKVLAEIKTMENVIFLKNKEEFWQEPKEIMDYVVQNCEKIDEIGDLEVYKK